MFLYNANETMKLLGHQHACGLLTGDGIAKDDFNNVIEAHRKQPRCTMFDIGIDMFMLGYIYGKRAVRSKTKERKC